jgi:hypothetical protein
MTLSKEEKKVMGVHWWIFIHYNSLSLSRSSGILATFWSPGLYDGARRSGRSSRTFWLTGLCDGLTRSLVGLNVDRPGMIFTDGAWRSGRPARDDRGLQILSRSRDEKYWGLNFGSLHTLVWGRISMKGNRPLGSLQEFHKITGTGDSLIPSLNWKH